MDCLCKSPGHCPKYNTDVSERQIQYCQGTSGLPRWKEEWYLNKLKEMASPSFLEQLTSIAKATVQHIAAGMPKVTDAEFDTRKSTCLQCPHFTKQEKCDVCGCYIKIKARWADQDCPLGLWPKVTASSGGCGCGS